MASNNSANSVKHSLQAWKRLVFHGTHSWRNFGMLVVILLITSCITIAHAFDSAAGTIATQVSTGTGSNGSRIWFSTGGSAITYINKDDDSTLYGNYFSGYYYDTVNGFFRFNWDTSNPGENNVHIGEVTDKCGNGGVGYKLAGYAKGDAGGYMNFSYNSEYFVYYCENDKKLRGYAYNTNEGFQNFDGITFDIYAATTNVPIVPNTTNDSNFVNNFSKITDPHAVTNEAEKISVFYIIK